MGLVKEGVPQIEGEIWVCAAQTSDKMVFECPDGPFRCVSSVNMRWHKLTLDVFFIEERFESFGCFVVESLKFGFESGLGKGVNCFATGGCRGCIGSGFHGFRVNAVAVTVVDDKNAIVAFAGRDREASSEVGTG